MGNGSVNFKPASREEQKAFAAVMGDIHATPIFGSEESHQYLVEEADEEFVLHTRSFASKKEVAAYCKKHPKARYLGKRPLETLLVV